MACTLGNMLSRVLFFAGAPEAQALRWDSHAGLLDEFDERITRFIGLDISNGPARDDSSSMKHAPYWRSIPYQKQHLKTGHSQILWKDQYKGAQFFATSYIDSLVDDVSASQVELVSSVQSVEEVLTQFYEQSYCLHQDVPSSQLQAVSQVSSRLSIGSSAYDTTDSFDTSANATSGIHLHEELPNCQVSNLKDIPNAKYINAINPQTLTVNLIVGIISVPEPRLIRTRRGADVKLVEVIIGDETKSGFVVNFWFPADLSVGENALRGLRPQDIVLLKNVALSSFRGRVYGQSLRKNITKIHLLYRNKLDSKDTGGIYKVSDLESMRGRDINQMKTSLVRDWVKLFVAVPTREHPTTSELVMEELPPDTPP